MKKWIAVLAAAMPLAGVHAHGVWVTPHYGELGIVYGMGINDDAYPASKVSEIKGFDAHFNAASVEHKGGESFTTVIPADNLAVMTVFFNNGYWKKGTVKKWEAVAKEDIQSAAETSTSLKYNISVLKSYDGKMKPFAHLPVQVIPTTDPTLLKQGDKLKVVVYVDGKPAADVPVTADYITDPKNRVKTNAQGEVELQVRNFALNVVAAMVGHPTPDDQYAHLQRSVATLSFKAKK